MANKPTANLNVLLIPELQRINAEFTDFTDFLKENVIIHDATLEDVETQDGEKFQSAVLWIEVEKTGELFLTRSSGFRVRQTVTHILQKDLLPIRCSFDIMGKSQLIKEPID